MLFEGRVPYALTDGVSHQTRGDRLRAGAGALGAGAAALRAGDLGAAAGELAPSFEGMNVAAKEWTPTAARLPARARAGAGAAAARRGPDPDLLSRLRALPPAERAALLAALAAGGAAVAPPKAPASGRKAAVRDATVCSASPEELEALAREVLGLCDAAPSGAILCANLPRLYYLKYRKPFDLKAYGAAKMAAVVSRLPGVHYAGTHRAEVSREGTGLGDGDDTVDASALAIREETQARVRAHRDALWPRPGVGAAATREAQTEKIRREALSLVDAWAGGDEARSTFGASALPRAVGPPPGF